MSEVPPRRVLVGTDMSAAAREALRAGVRWSRRTGAELTVCFSVPREIEEQLLERGIADHVADWVRTNAPEMRSPNIRLATGSGHAGLLDAVDEVRPEVVVIGPTGAGNAGEGKLGSTAKVVVRHASCPVLVSREERKS